MQLKPDPPREEWEPTKQTFWISKGEDLWRVAHKSKWARLTVPSLEFEIQADGQRHIDSIYNHFGNAVTNLAAYASGLPMGAQQFPACSVLWVDCLCFSSAVWLSVQAPDCAAQLNMLLR